MPVGDLKRLKYARHEPITLCMSVRGKRFISGFLLTAGIVSLASTLIIPGMADARQATVVADPSVYVIEHFPVQGICGFTDTYGAPRSGGRIHEGVDVLAAAGKLLYAVADGKLTRLVRQKKDQR